MCLQLLDICQSPRFRNMNRPSIVSHIYISSHPNQREFFPIVDNYQILQTRSYKRILQFTPEYVLIKTRDPPERKTEISITSSDTKSTKKAILRTYVCTGRTRHQTLMLPRRACVTASAPRPATTLPPADVVGGAATGPVDAATTSILIFIPLSQWPVRPQRK